MRRNYISNSLFAFALITFICIVKFTGYFSAAFLKDDFFYGAIILPVVIIFSVFNLVWVALNYKNKSGENILTSIISMITTISISLMISLLPQILLLIGNGLQIVLVGIIISFILFNVGIIEGDLYKKRKAD